MASRAGPEQTGGMECQVGTGSKKLEKGTIRTAGNRGKKKIHATSESGGHKDRHTNITRLYEGRGRL